MIVGAPGAPVGGPWPPDVVDVRALQGQGSLLEIGVGMRGEPGLIARPVLRIDDVEHQGRTAKDPPEPAFPRGYVQAVDGPRRAVRRRGPGGQRGDVEMV